MTKRMSKKNLPQFVMSGDGFNLFSDDRDWLEQHPWRKWGTIYVQEQAAGSGRVGGDAMNDTEETAADAARRFARENERLAAQVAALTAEREEFRVAVERILVAHLGGWKADGSGWYDYYLCECGARASTREAVQHIVDCPLATTPPAGAQEIAPEASEPMEQCEWCGRQYPRSEMNTMPWPDDEHTRRICDRCVDEPN